MFFIFKALKYGPSIGYFDKLNSYSGRTDFGPRHAASIDAAPSLRHLAPMTSKSPLAPASFPDLPEISGVTRRIARAQYKAWDRCDLTYIELAQGTAAAGVTTRNICCSSEVETCRISIKRGAVRALVVNAGNSNAFTGYRGREAVEGIMAQVAAHLGCAAADVFVCSTGVIGVPLPQDKARDGLNVVFTAQPCSWQDAAETICTTDTFAKGACASAMVAGQRVEVVGIAKGSGMIAPDMATMLAYVFTDAAVTPALLQAMISSANDGTFNCITVDGDTSTSDTLLVFATGAAGNAPLRTMSDDGAEALYEAIQSVCRDLAQQIVCDGEGAQKFITITVTGAVSDESARRIGLAIGNSPLVKTAIAGGDANWGRVVMAVGKAGEPADRDRLSISFGGCQVARMGMPVDGYDEAPVAAHLAGHEIHIGVDIGMGEGRATIWTCDLTHGYIRINADYRS